MSQEIVKKLDWAIKNGCGFAIKIVVTENVWNTSRYIEKHCSFTTELLSPDAIEFSRIRYPSVVPVEDRTDDWFVQLGGMVESLKGRKKYLISLVMNEHDFRRLGRLSPHVYSIAGIYR